MHILVPPKKPGQLLAGSDPVGLFVSSGLGFGRLVSAAFGAASAEDDEPGVTLEALSNLVLSGRAFVEALAGAVKLGMLKGVGDTAFAEWHVKDFMVRHRKLLGLGDQDVAILETLRDRDYQILKSIA